MPSKKNPKVVDKKLGRNQAVGQMVWDKNIIEIDPRQTPPDYLDTLIHEKLHHLFPDWKEDEVLKIATSLAEFLWSQNYRKVNL